MPAPVPFFSGSGTHRVVFLRAFGEDGRFRRLATRLSDDLRCYCRPHHTRTPTQAARFNDGIVGLLGKLPILGRSVP
jgi:hypothetical protein